MNVVCSIRLTMRVVRGVMLVVAVRANLTPTTTEQVSRTAIQQQTENIPMLQEIHSFHFIFISFKTTKGHMACW